MDTDPNEDEFAEWKRQVRDLDGFDSNGALDHSLVLLGIGHDSAHGRLVLDPQRDRLVVDYPGYPEEPIFSRISGMMEKLIQVLRGTYIQSPRWSALLGRNLTTVHPLGGCPMEGKKGGGVVNPLGQVHGHENLYVADGSIVPTAVGVNPAFTISALAERIAEKLIQKLTRHR